MRNRASRHSEALYVAAIVVGAMCAGLSAYLSYAWPLAIIGLLPIMHAIVSRRLTYRVAFVFAFTYIGISLGAYWAAIPMPWLGIRSVPLAASIVFVQWIVIALPFSALVSAGLVMLSRHASRSRIVTTTLFGASLMTLIEYLLMWVYAVIMYGAGATIEPHYSAHMIGYALADSPFVMLARYGGVFLLSWFAFACVILIAYLLDNRIRAVATRTFAALIVIALVLVNLRIPADVDGIVAAAVSVDSARSSFSSSQKREDVRAALESLMDAQPDLGLIVLPESIELLAGHPEGPPQWRSSDPRLTIIDTVVATSSAFSLKQAVFFTPESGARIVADKSFLAPPREYVPAFVSWSSLLQDTSLRMRAGTPKPAQLGSFAIGASICLDSMSPIHSRALARDGAQILTNSAALNWFNERSLVHTKVAAMNRVRAVEAGRYLVIGTDSGPAQIIDPYGRRIATTRIETGAAIARVGLRDDTTPYVAMGAWVMTILLVFTTLSWAALRKDDQDAAHDVRRDSSSA